MKILKLSAKAAADDWQKIEDCLEVTTWCYSQFPNTPHSSEKNLNFPGRTGREAFGRPFH